MAEIELQNIANTPEVLVDGFQGASATNGVVRINFFRTVYDPGKNEQSRHGAVVLSMSVETLARVAKAMGTLIQDMEKRGAIRIEMTQDKV